MMRLSAFLLMYLGATSLVSADIRVDRRSETKTAGSQLMNSDRPSDSGGTLTSVFIRGDRRMTVTANVAAQLVDLKEEKIYNIDLRRRRYRVTTFEQIREQHRQVAAMMEKLRGTTGGSERAVPDAVRLAETLNRARHSRFEMVRKQTGRRQVVNGFDALEVVSTTRTATGEDGETTVTIVEWLVPEIENYGEIEQFETRYAAMLGEDAWRAQIGAMSGTAGTSGFVSPLMADYKVEDDGTKGIPVLTVTVMEGRANAERAEKEQKGSAGPRGFFGRLAGRRGPGEYQGWPPGMISQTEIVAVSTRVRDADVSVPEGFKDETRRR